MKSSVFILALVAFSTACFAQTNNSAPAPKAMSVPANMMSDKDRILQQMSSLKLTQSQSGNVGAAVQKYLDQKVQLSDVPGAMATAQRSMMMNIKSTMTAQQFNSFMSMKPAPGDRNNPLSKIFY